jgi:hypothetical protein
MFTDVMIDIETTSTQTNAVILSIGAVAFNLYNPELDNKSLNDSENNGIELLIHKNSCDEIGLHTCEETMKWWNNQSEIVRKRAFLDEPRINIKDGLLKLSEFCEKYKFKRYWAQGINFDFVVLENAYNVCNIKNKIVWKFYQLRDSRTIRFMVDTVPEKPIDAHNAIADCKYQINMIQYVYRKLGLISSSSSTVLTNTITSTTNNSGNNNYSGNNNSSKKRIISKPGDWLCLKCNSTNFSYRGDCYNCGFIYNEELKNKQKNDWNCEKCQALNFSYRKECYKCSKELI